MLNIRTPQRDAKGNVIAGADISTRWGPMSVVVTLPKAAIDAGAGAALTSGLTYGAQALAESVSGSRMMAMTPRSLSQSFAAIPPDQQHSASVGALAVSTSPIHENASRIAAVMADPYRAPITHVLYFKGKTVDVTEAALEVARDEKQAEQALRSLSAAPGPLEQSCAEQILAACAVRAVMADPSKLAVVKAASEAGHESATALRQGVVAARLADMRSAAIALATKVRKGDKQANLLAQSVCNSALAGDENAALYARCFSDAFAHGASIQEPAVPLTPQDAPPRDPITQAPAPVGARDPLAGENGLHEGMTPDEIERAIALQELAKPPAPIKPEDVKPTGTGSVGPAPQELGNVVPFRRGA